MTLPTPPAHGYHFFGRRKGRPLRTKKTELMLTLLPRVAIELPDQDRLDMVSLFSSTTQGYRLEIEFGSGEHLAAHARTHPTIGFLGCEPFRNGIAGLLDHIDQNHLPNIRIYPDDARKLLEKLPNAILDRCYLLFADPWPKARHEDRRFVSHSNLTRLARVLKLGAQFWVATDDETLKEWTLSIVKEHPEYEPIYQAHEPPPEWVPTRYEEKARRAGRLPLYLIYRLAQ